MTNYRWLSRVLCRSSFYLRVHIADETRTEEERKELTERLHQQLDRLERDSTKVMEVLRIDAEERATHACDSLLEHLMSEV